MNHIRCVIFDMDGVLIDAKEWHYEALNQALNHFGFTITREMHEGEFDGLPTRDKLLRLSERYSLPHSLHDSISRMKQIYTMRLIHQRCSPVSAHMHALENLRKEGLHLAVASNSVRSSIETMLGRAQLLQFLDFTVSAEDVTRGKPDPEIYFKTMGLMGVNPKECVIVEDNPHGLAAARATGSHVLAVRNPSDVTWERLHAFISQC